MRANRREVLALGGAAALFGAGPAAALTESEARALIKATVDDLFKLLVAKDSAGAIAPKLRAIMERRANLPQIARFAAGRSWRAMSHAQRARYQDAFAHFVSVIYARRFEEFSGNVTINVSRVTDLGRKGFLVGTPIMPPSGEPLAVEWLVSDRGGRVEVVDIVVEGISMAVTQREEIAAMLESKGGDIDALIGDLAGVTAS